MSTTTRAYGSITIVDITDVGSFSVYPSSNMPLTVIYNSDSGSFTPAWDSTNPLVLTPVMYYAGKHIEVTNKDAVVTWQYQYGKGAPVDIKDDKGNLIKGELTISDMKHISPEADPNTNTVHNQSGLLTFICKAKYTEPISGADVEAVGQITFALNRTAKELKYCEIKGEDVFLYDEYNKIKGSSTIRLTAVKSETTAAGDNVGQHGWFYFNTVTNTWVSLNNLGVTIDISADGDCFNHKNGDTSIPVDKVRIKYVTKDTTVYDEMSIYKLRDGVSGTSVISVVLSNQDQTIPYENETTACAGAFDSAFTTIKIYEGAIDVTKDWKVEIGATSNIVGELCAVKPDETEIPLANSSAEIPADISHYKYKANDFSATGDKTIKDISSGSVTFNLIYRGTSESTYAPTTKTFTVTKVIVGHTPEYYSVEPNVTTVKRIITKGENGSEVIAYEPETITFTAYRNHYNEGWKKDEYAGRLYSTDLTSQTQEDNSTATFNFTNFTKSDNSVTFSLYAAGTSFVDSANATPLDIQTVLIISDGEQGEQGEQGEPGYSTKVSNVNFSIPCDSDGYVLADQTIEIPFAFYKGTSKISCTLNNTVLNLSKGMSVDGSKSVLSPGDGQSGKLVINLSAIVSDAKNDLNSNDTGNINMLLTHTEDDGDEVQFLEEVEWRKTKQPRGAITFEIFTPSTSNVIHNGTGNVILDTLLREGEEDNLPGVTYQWYKFDPASEATDKYDTLANQDNKSLTVDGGMVSAYASFKCVATYRGKGYAAYYTVFDEYDSLEATIVCTLGDKILNSRGYGAVYTKITVDDQPAEDLPTEVFVTSVSDCEKLSLENEDLCYLVDKATHGVYLKKYVIDGNTKKLEDYTDPRTFTHTYTYTFRGADGLSTNLKYTEGDEGVSQVTDRVFYIDAHAIDKKITIDVTVNTVSSGN
ncbi:MAG: hypothetical protein UH850_11270 [Paludibacteraceae bacterium]|nr:hypothetical protein [Paludibacteraceae bacterium]